MVHEFDLQAPDYIAASLYAQTTQQVVRAYVPYALIAGLAAWIVAHLALNESPPVAALVGAIVFGGVLVYFSMTWRSTLTRVLTKFYATPDKRAILGPHTLELSIDGLHSEGPLHRSFRAWPSITHVVRAPSHFFFHTAFGVIYVLPLRAVPNREAVVTTIAAKEIPMI